MASQLLSGFTTTLCLAIVVVSSGWLWSIRPRGGSAVRSNDMSEPDPCSREFEIIAEGLHQLLPHSVMLPRHGDAFRSRISIHWAQQENEVVPACIIRPHDANELCEAVKYLKDQFSQKQCFFAIRSGGHSPVSGAASTNDGVLIDLSLLSEMKLSDDGSTVAIGAGARWSHVSQILDQKGLAIVGSRNSQVGVGGLVLGGGLSFFSPRYGMVCSNIISYDVVLASGSTAVASAEDNPDLWRALKGGGNNFGIVTRIIVPTFPNSSVWSGFLYLPSFQTSKVIKAFYEVVAGSSRSDGIYDQYTAGPIASFSYIHQIGIHAIAVNLVHTNPPSGNRWPEPWKLSPFASIWRLWSTCKVRTLTSATDELAALNPPGRRQMFATATIKNDLQTLVSIHLIHMEAVASLRKLKVKGLVWTLVLQPLLPIWTRKGDPNSLGLEGSDPLVIISYTTNWDASENDNLIRKTMIKTIDQIKAIAKANDTHHRYKYANYCASWQNPYAGYGDANLRFLQATSKEYDPDGFFQKACNGGFKLMQNNGSNTDSHTD